MTEDRTSLKRMKLESQAYKELLKFHEYGEYRKYLIELSRAMGDDSIVNVPLEIYSYLGHVRSLVQSIQPGQMSFNALAQKLDISSLLAALNAFYLELDSIDCLDLTHITSEDIVYGGKVEIFHPENIKVVKCDKRKNIAHVNREIIKGIFNIDEINIVDEELKDMVGYSLIGDIGADTLLDEITELESKRRGKAKYLKHINNGYIK